MTYATSCAGMTSARSSFFRSGYYPATVIGHLGAAIGPPTHESGASVWFHVQERLGTASTH